jgi:hypothetical protein
MYSGVLGIKTFHITGTEMTMKLCKHCGVKMIPISINVSLVSQVSSCRRSPDCVTDKYGRSWGLINSLLLQTSLCALILMP